MPEDATFIQNDPGFRIKGMLTSDITSKSCFYRLILF